MVARLNGVQEAAGSNPASPTSLPVTGRMARPTPRVHHAQAALPFASLCEAAGIAAVPHDLRHTCATKMVNRGVDILAIQRLPGRSNVQTTQRYGRLGDREYRRALEADLS